MKKTEQQIILGLHSAEAALKNHKREIFRIICTADIFRKLKVIIEERKVKRIEIIRRKEIDKKVKNTIHQGIVIFCSFLKNHFLEDIDNQENLILILDSLNDSQNVGSIMRTALLFGVKTIIYNKHNSFEISPFLIKSASGSFEKIKLIEVNNLNQAINYLKKMKFWTFGLTANKGQVLAKSPKNMKTALIVGSENRGIRQLIMKKCDFLMNIDTQKDLIVDSLNVSNAVAIALYELTKK